MILSSYAHLAWPAATVLAVLLLIDFNAPKKGIISRSGKLLRRQNAHSNYRDPDGHFNDLPVFYEEFHDGFHSHAHCVGENFVRSNERNAAWRYRSCEFRNLCFDMEDREFLLFLSKEQMALDNALRKGGPRQFWPASSSTDDMAVAVGGTHPRWGGLDKVLKWYPKFRELRDVFEEDKTDNFISGYYTLPSDHVFVPWNSYHGYNPGHIITDDFLPIYTLLSYFDLTDKELAMIHIDLLDNNATNRWDNCQNHWKLCKPYMERFLPLLGTELRKTSTQYTAKLEVDGGEARSRYICAAHGVAGMGMLTDHGKKLHGNFEKDFLWTHNVGRGDSFHRFRDWMVGRLLGSNVEKRDLSRPPYRIVISNNSSSDPRRIVSFGEHAAALRRALGNKYELDVRQVRLADMSLAEQVGLAAGASVLVTAAGGGASVAHFLPRRASLLLYFSEFPPNKNVSGDYNGWVMDWDTYNNFGYVRAHWLPIRHGNVTSSQRESDIDVFVKLVDQELDLISHIDDYD